MPSRPRSPRPRPNPARRPRVAGLAPAAPRPDAPAHPSGPAEDPAAASRAPEPEERAGSAGPAAPPQADPDPDPGADAPAGPDVPRPSRRRPSGEARAAGSTPAEDGVEESGEPADTDPGDTDPADTGSGAARTGLAAASRRHAVPLLATALVLLTAFAVVAGLQDAALRGTPAAQNTALVDVGATAEVAQQLSEAVQTIYSFDFARLDENADAAHAVITPAFAEEFEGLFAEVRARAPEQQAVVSATVTFSAVKEITGDRAVLVAFVDQQATRAAPGAEGQQLAAAGRLTVVGERVDGRWKIADVTPL